MTRRARGGYVPADEEAGKLRVSVFEVRDFEGVGDVATLTLLLELALVRILMTRATFHGDALQPHSSACPRREDARDRLMTR